MNIKKLAEQAGFVVGVSANADRQVKHFAELVAEQTHTNNKAKWYQEGYEAGRHDEREACARLCESMGVYPELNVWNGGPDWYKRQKECAAAIRARGDKHD